MRASRKAVILRIDILPAVIREGPSVPQAVGHGPTTAWASNRRTAASLGTSDLQTNTVEVPRPRYSSQIGCSVLVQNIVVLTAVAADKGYNWEVLRMKLRSEGITPVIPTRVMDLHGLVRNPLTDDRTDHQRSDIESVLFGLRRRYGETLWSRTWYGQFRELVMKSAVRNIERAIKGSDP